MRTNVKRVIAAFDARKKLKVGSISTSGNVIYSYALPIAMRNESDDIVVFTYDNIPQSATTRSQIRALQYHYRLPLCGHSDCARNSEMAEICIQATLTARKQASA